MLASRTPPTWKTGDLENRDRRPYEHSCPSRAFFATDACSPTILLDPAATQDSRSIIADDRLTGSDAVTRLVENNLQPAVR